MFDVNAAETEAKKELADEQSKEAKKKIKSKLKQIADAEKIVTNLRIEYDAILADIGNG